MRHANRLRALGVAGLMVGSMALLPHCSAVNDISQAAQGCDGLDVKVNKADVTVKAFADSAANLKAAALKIEQQWATVCNKINGELGLDTSKTDAAGACGVLNARVADALAKGVKVSLEFDYGCSADVSASANCEASCAAAVDCDIAAKCEPGKLAVECNGSCEGTCEVRAPSVACEGKCEGTCTADVTAACEGKCEGSCTAPQWTGTCSAGCEAEFSGTCSGTCEGKCDGTATTGGSEGNCKGKCEGKCTGTATGSCKAACTGTYSGGKCEGTCTGKCAVEGNVDCKGSCSGSCSYDPGEAKCQGTCRGSCSAEVSPPRCEGKLDCNVDANCKGSCDAQASASLQCGGTTNVVIEGDVDLYNAIVKYQGDIAAAFGATTELYKPIVDLADKFGGAIKATGDLTAAGGVCIVSSLAVAVEAKASINVSVQASLSVQGKAEASSGS